MSSSFVSPRFNIDHEQDLANLEYKVKKKNLQDQLSGNIGGVGRQQSDADVSANRIRDAREAMNLRREENDYNRQKDFESREQVQNSDLGRRNTEFKFRQDATEAAAVRQKGREMADANRLKADIGWTR